MRTSSIAQRLYLDALISYPRTSSQKLPPAIGYKAVLAKLAKMPAYGKQAAELLCKSVLKPNEGEKADPAHPAIYPTGNMPENPIGTSEIKIFDLIIRRFMAIFDEPAIRQNIKVTVSVNGNRFHLNEVRTLSEGWLRFYKPYVQLKDVTLPTLTEGQKITVKGVFVKNNFTKPPVRYNPQSLLLKMEKEEIGTKATRAAIIQTLYDRKYLGGNESLVFSDLGFEVIEILAKYCPTVVSPEFTRKLEEKMNEIQRGNETKEAVLQNAVEALKPTLLALKENETVIGLHLSQALKKAWLDERTVGACPKCAGGKLVILSSKKTGKRFVGCTNYFEDKCNATFPLPQNGSVKPINITCKTCGFPMLAVLLKKKRPWKLCLNPNCPTKNVGKQ
jgi:DNA topoisomerase-1